MIDDVRKEAEVSMKKALEALDHAFNKIRTGRASPSLLDTVFVDYYGSMVPIAQVANISIEDGRTLAISPWEKTMISPVEKAILKSDLGLNPSTSGDNIRISMPALTEETRRDLVKHAKAEAEKARISIRNQRRDANSMIKDFLKDKEVSEDDARHGEDLIQKLTDGYIELVEKALGEKEADLMQV